VASEQGIQEGLASTAVVTREGSLVDRSVLHGLHHQLSAADAAELLGRGFASVERSCMQLKSLSSDSEILRREAHALKGTAATFGLRGINEMAAKIEAMFRDDKDITMPIEQLNAVVLATRQELLEMGMLDMK
jgi:HPt (histidine-containing phosphotransfer) domain-containing protein